MKKLNTAISALVIFIVFTAFYAAGLRRVAKEISVSLADGETYSFRALDQQLYDNEYKQGSSDFYNANLFFGVDSLQVPGSSVLKPFETTNNNAKDLISYVNRIAIGRSLGYQEVFDRAGGMDAVTDPRYAFRDTSWQIQWDKADGFREYYHSLFKAKNARMVLFNEALGIVASMAQKYPVDFRKRVITEIDSLLLFTKSLTKKKYSESVFFEAYWSGFIYRRHFVDKVPVAEIEQSLKKARSTIAAVKPKIDNAFKVTLNDALAVFTSAGSFVLYSVGSKKEISIRGTLDEVKYAAGKGYEFSYFDAKGKSFTATYDAQLKKVAK